MIFTTILHNSSITSNIENTTTIETLENQLQQLNKLELAKFFTALAVNNPSKLNEKLCNLYEDFNQLQQNEVAYLIEKLYPEEQYEENTSPTNYQEKTSHH